MQAISATDISQVYYRHVDTVYRLCYSFMRNVPETEDMVQETFLRLLSSGKQFENERHEKAWLIVTASNLCKDELKRWWRRNEPLEDHPELETQEATGLNPVLDAILNLPDMYKTVVYMYYYEGYSTQDIAKCLHCPHATVRSRLARARKLLEQVLGGDQDG